MSKGKIRWAAGLLSGVSLGLGALHLVKLRTSKGIGLWPFKVLAQTVSPLLGAMGAAGALLGWLGSSPLAWLAGMAGAVLSGRYVKNTVTSTADLESALGAGWEEHIAPEQRAHMLKKRWTPWLKGAPEARCTKDVVFACVNQGAGAPGPERPLLCDVWQPPAGVAPSGLSMVYLHGGAWYLGDKNMATGAFFRHLAAQGHVVMDVAYRLAPEATMLQMVHDAKRAVTWLKAHAASYGVDPDRIVLAGGSAGAHLALLTAYTPGHPDLTPDDLAGADTSVRAVVSFYGPTDLQEVADYNPTFVRAADDPMPPPEPMPAFDDPRWWVAQWEMLHAGVPSAHQLAGCEPHELPQMYELGSPIRHVGTHCPPTLLLHGTHDFIVPVESARALYQELLRADVPVAYLELPGSEHAFDLALPRLSPPAQVAWYEVDRFLAFMAGAHNGAPR